MRDDADMEVWVSDIKLRAGIRIGELSLQPDKATPGTTKGGRARSTSTISLVS